MSIVLELRGRSTHAGVPLVHTRSESVVLANVFGALRHLPAQAVVNRWLAETSGGVIPAAQQWSFSFWETQPRPVGVAEGSTEVDLVLSSGEAIVFVEVKLDALASAGTRANPERDQLTRNLDIGRRRAARDGKLFFLIYVTADAEAPAQVERSGSGARDLFWCAWDGIAAAAAEAYVGNALSACESGLVLDLLAYCSHKGLWHNTLPDSELFYEDKLYRSLRTSGSPFVPYRANTRERYDDWRTKEWDEISLRSFLAGLREEDKALLKLLADAGGTMQQHAIMAAVPVLRGKSSAALRALKSHINAGCKSLDRAALLAQGSGTGGSRVHEISQSLGPLRPLVIEVARAFDVRWELLERENASPSPDRTAP